MIVDMQSIESSLCIGDIESIGDVLRLPKQTLPDVCIQDKVVIRQMVF